MLQCDDAEEKHFQLEGKHNNIDEIFPKSVKTNNKGENRIIVALRKSLSRFPRDIRHRNCMFIKYVEEYLNRLASDCH